LNTLELCRVLLAGSVPAAEVPELTDEEIRSEVRRRLAEAGCDLAYAPRSDRWVATLGGALPRLEDHAVVIDLGPAELAVLAACWLHLRFLDAERVRQGAGVDTAGRGEPWLDPDDLGIMLGGRLGGRDLGDVLVLLCQAGYLTLREGQLFAGPLLETFDDQAAGDEVRELLARNQRLTHLRERAAEIKAEAAEFDPSPPTTAPTTAQAPLGSPGDRRESEFDPSTPTMAQAPLGGRGGSELPPHGSGIEPRRTIRYGDSDA
jgi:hypothetical protein